MSKIAIISDTHWGVRGDSIPFLDMTKKFLDDIFFPTLEQQSIDTVLHLGDLVDRRKQISYLTAQRLRSDFIEPIIKRKLKVHFIVGNHDCYYKNTNKVNALSEMVEGISNNFFCYIDQPEEVKIYGTNFLMVPWICDENKEISISRIKKSKATICAGHLEIVGFEMYKGAVATHGQNKDFFEKFPLTISGHYHHKSSNSGITYVGSHGEFTWSDCDDPRGFHILDTRTLELTFVKNPYGMFTKLFYNDTESNLDSLLTINENLVTNKHVKIIVNEKSNPYWFDKFCETVEKHNPLSMQIIEDSLKLELSEEDELVNEAESTLDIFRKIIETIDSNNIDKVHLNKFITELYNEALAVE